MFLRNLDVLVLLLFIMIFKSHTAGGHVLLRNLDVLVDPAAFRSLCEEKRGCNTSSFSPLTCRLTFVAT